MLTRTLQGPHCKIMWECLWQPTKKHTSFLVLDVFIASNATSRLSRAHSRLSTVIPYCTVTIVDTSLALISLVSLAVFSFWSPTLYHHYLNCELLSYFPVFLHIMKNIWSVDITVSKTAFVTCFSGFHSEHSKIVRLISSSGPL